MPWRESGPMDERLRFVRDAQRNHFTMSELLLATSPPPLGRTADGLGARQSGIRKES
jgi:hypothetical protein